VSSAGRYYRVPQRFWQDKDIRALPEDARVLALYLKTSPHRNMVGLFYCPLAYMETDLQWDSKRLRKAFEALLDGLIAYDWDQQIVFLRDALEDDPPGNVNQRKGAINALKSLPPTPLLAEVLKAAERHCEALAKDIRKAFGGLSIPLRTTDSESDTDSESCTKEREASAGAAPPLEPSKSEISPERVVELWNEICGGSLHRVTDFTPKRRQHVKARLNAKPERRTEPWWRNYFQTILATPFCMGENDRGWKASFDFAVRSEDSVVKILEGHYGGGRGSRGAPGGRPGQPAREPSGPAAQTSARRVAFSRATAGARGSPETGLGPDRGADPMEREGARSAR